MDKSDMLFQKEPGGGQDVFFLLYVPAGTTVLFQETTSSDVTLRQIADCSSTTCIDFEEAPEQMTFTATGFDMMVYIVVSEDSANAVDAFTITANAV